MLRPTTGCLCPLPDQRGQSRGYFLSEVRLEIPDAETAVFKAKLNGPAGAPVWARAWLSSETDGTLAESVSPPLNAGDFTALTVVLRDSRVPENACMRIESAPLATEHVVFIKLPPTKETCATHRKPLPPWPCF